MAKKEISIFFFIRICEIVNSFGQGNFTLVRKKSGKSQGTEFQ